MPAGSLITASSLMRPWQEGFGSRLICSNIFAKDKEVTKEESTLLTRAAVP